MVQAGSVEEQAWLASVLPEPKQLDELLGNDPTAVLLGIAKSRAPIELGPQGPPPADPELKKQFELARAAAEELKKSATVKLKPEQVAALHAFVHLLARPALRVVDGVIPAIPDSWQRLQTAHDSVVDAIRGVGRVDNATRGHVGTAWFVAENLLLTNRHVAGALCGLDPHDDPAWLTKLPNAVVTTNVSWKQDPKKRAVWDPAEVPSAASEKLGSIRQIRAVHEHLDMALLDVDGVENSSKLVLRMHGAGPKSTTMHDVYLAGYPGVSPPHGVSPQVAALLFPGAAGGLKRISPGQLVQLEADLPIEDDKPRESHDASTLGGSSGSPVIDFHNHRVVAIHYSGFYGGANYSVPLWLVKDDPFFTDNGVTFAS